MGFFKQLPLATAGLCRASEGVVAVRGLVLRSFDM